MTGELARTLGRSLRALRERAGKTQQEVAAALGYERSYIQAIEAGKENRGLDLVERFAEAFGIDEPLQLLDGTVLNDESIMPTLRAARTGRKAPPDARTIARRRRPGRPG